MAAIPEKIGALVSGIAGEPLALAIGQLRLWLRNVSGKIDEFTRMLEDTQKETSATLKTIGFSRWARFWHIGRQLISLQQRLLLEQIYSDMGKPWSDLITGFGPLSGTDPVSFGEAVRRQRERLTGTRFTRVAYRTPLSIKRNKQRRRRRRG